MSDQEDDGPRSLNYREEGSMKQDLSVSFPEWVDEEYSIVGASWRISGVDERKLSGKR